MRGGGTPTAGGGGHSYGWWRSPTALYASAAIITGAVLATNVLTWGADAEIDPAALGFAGAWVAPAPPR